MLPFVIPFTFFFLLPRPDAFSSLSVALHPDIIVSSPSEYTALPSTDPSTNPEQEEDGDEISDGRAPQLSASKLHVSLSPADKWRLVRPLMVKYMLPLCTCLCVYSRVMYVQLIFFIECIFSLCVYCKPVFILLIDADALTYCPVRVHNKSGAQNRVAFRHYSSSVLGGLLKLTSA